MKIEASIVYQVVDKSKFYFQCVHHRLASGKRFEWHCHRSKLNFWYWRNEYTSDTSKVSGFWMSFVSGTHFYRQKTKCTKPAANPVLTTRVLGLPIRDCAGSCNSSVQMCTTVNAIDVTTKAIFEHWYLVPGRGTLGPSVNCWCGGIKKQTWSCGGVHGYLYNKKRESGTWTRFLFLCLLFVTTKKQGIQPGGFFVYECVCLCVCACARVGDM